MIKSENQPDIHEILKLVSTAKTEKEKLALLQQHNCLGLRDILRGAFDDSIIWNLPEGRPDFVTGLSTEGYSPTNLRSNTRNFRYMVKGGEGDGMQAVRRERMFIEILEGVKPDDAEVMVAMKDKKLSNLYPGITKALVKKAFPKLISK